MPALTSFGVIVVGALDQSAPAALAASARSQVTFYLFGGRDLEAAPQEATATPTTVPSDHGRVSGELYRVDLVRFGAAAH